MFRTNSGDKLLPFDPLKGALDATAGTDVDGEDAGVEPQASDAVVDDHSLTVLLSSSAR